MTHYRLLRDNKESGPFSEEEMIAKGFKPYDLIWVEGRSAGWRYPSEIPSFKAFAPAIEEQPYDRFYKKQPEQKLFSEERAQSALLNKEKETVKTDKTPNPVTSKAPEYSIKALPGKHIHVILPSGNTVNLNALVAKNENTTPKETVSIDNAESAYSNGAISEQTAVKAIAQSSFKKEEPVAEPIVAKAIGEYDLPDTNSYETQPIVYTTQNTNSSGFSWGLIAAAFIGFATLVGLGIMIGLTLAKQPGNTVNGNELSTNKSKEQLQDNSTNKQASQSTVADVPSPIVDEPVQQPLNSGNNNKELVQNAVVKNTVLPEDAGLNKAEKKSTEEKSAGINSKEQSSGASLNNKPTPAPVNVEKTLSLTTNDFRTGAFGGISGLKYTLFNGSRYTLESVEVEVDYIQANDKVFKTEKLIFKDIPSGTQTTIEAPSSNRGVKLNSRIIKINTREGGLNNTTAKS
ncbi:MAG: hypothetical protein QM726_14005 [Chitinophagaceae bacterium]